MLEEYIAQAGFTGDPKGWLFRTAASKNGTAFTNTPCASRTFTP
jgi:hypothetical protein